MCRSYSPACALLSEGIYSVLRGYKDLMCKTMLITAATRRANEMTS